MRKLSTGHQTVLEWFTDILPDEYMPKHIGLTAWTYRNVGYEVGTVRGWTTPHGRVCFILAYRSDGPASLLGAWQHRQDRFETLFESQWDQELESFVNQAQRRYWESLWKRALSESERVLVIAVLVLYALSAWLFMDSPFASQENILPLCLAGIFCVVVFPALLTSRLKRKIAYRRLVKWWREDPLADTIQRLVWEQEGRPAVARTEPTTSPQ
jgi:hypothetical protein